MTACAKVFIGYFEHEDALSGVIDLSKNEPTYCSTQNWDYFNVIWSLLLSLRSEFNGLFALHIERKLEREKNQNTIIY